MFCFFVYLLLILSSIYYKNCIVYFLYTIVRHIQFSKTNFGHFLTTSIILLKIKLLVKNKNNFFLFFLYFFIFFNMITISKEKTRQDYIT